MNHLKMHVTLVLLSATALIFSPTVFAAQKGCETVEASQDYLAAFDATIEGTRSEIKANEAKRQEAIDLKSNALIANGQWTQEDQQKFLNKIRSSKAFQNLEQQKTPHLNKFQFSLPMVIGLKTKRPMGACEFAKDAISSLIEIGKINQKQYDQMEKSFPKVKGADSK